MNSPLRVIHIITDLSDGGAEAVLSRLCVSDRVNAHHVVSLMDGGKYGPILQSHGIPVTCLDMPRGRITLSGLIRLGRLLRELKPNIVQTWMYHADLVGGVMARLSGVRNVFWNIRHSSLSHKGASRMTVLVARLCASLSRIVPTGIICCAEAAAKAHAEVGYDRRRMVVIPNGYDLSRFVPDPEAGQALRRSYGLLSGVAVIGMVGRFDPSKDHENLLRALALLKARGIAFRCLLVGKGMEPSYEPARQLVDRYGLSAEVLLLGQRADVPVVMNALDIHVLSSVSEGFPNVLAEAMACGVPCVTTDVGDAAMIVGDVGWVVPPSNPEALADGIAGALQAERDSESWAGRKNQVRELVRMRFELSRMVATYSSLWNREGDYINAA